MSNTCSTTTRCTDGTSCTWHYPCDVRPEFNDCCERLGKYTADRIGGGTLNIVIGRSGRSIEVIVPRGQRLNAGAVARYMQQADRSTRSTGAADTTSITATVDDVESKLTGFFKDHWGKILVGLGLGAAAAWAFWPKKKNKKAATA